MSSTFEIIKQPGSTPSATRVDKNPMNLAAGWYIAMESKDLEKKPKAIELFGLPLVAWRDQTAHPAIMQRHCSHMGASLAIGKVVDGCIQCPYHHWRYNGSGDCVSIPEVDRIPPTAHQATYVTIEKYGYIWVWYGSPTPLFPVPKFLPAEVKGHKYVAMRLAHPTKTTAQRVAENAFDHYHTVTLHKQKVSGQIKTTLLDHDSLEQQSELPIPKEAWFGTLAEFSVPEFFGVNATALALRVDAWSSGHIATAFVDGEERLNALVCTTPIAPGHTIAQLLLMMKKTNNPLQNLIYYLFFSRQTKINTLQDIDIWDTEYPDAGKAFVIHDKLLLKFREFYQRWIDKVS